MTARKLINLFKKHFSSWKEIGRWIALIRISENHEDRLDMIESYLEGEQEYKLHKQKENINEIEKTK